MRRTIDIDKRRQETMYMSERKKLNKKITDDEKKGGARESIARTAGIKSDADIECVSSLSFLESSLWLFALSLMSSHSFDYRSVARMDSLSRVQI